MSRRWLWFALAASLGMVAHAGTIPPDWNSNFGSNVLQADDGVVVQNLGFAFPFFGNTYNAITISSNGFIWLGGDDTFTSDCCNGSPFGLVNGGPRIAGGWVDLNSSEGEGLGEIDFNGDSSSAVVTFNNVAAFENQNLLYSFQIQLFASGEIILAFNSFPNPQDRHDMLVGITPGGGTPDPGSTNFFTSSPGQIVHINPTGTIYQLIPAANPGNSTEFASFAAVAPGFDGNEIIFDAVATPEPASLGLMGLGVAALVDSRA